MNHLCLILFQYSSSYYIEDEGDAKILSTNLNSFMSLELRGQSDVHLHGDIDERRDPKVRLIADIFTRNLCKRMDKEFLEKNKEFKEIMYELIRDEYIVKNRIRITYLPPDEVVHMTIDENEETGYGTSKFKKILFTAKLYLAVLTCTLMMKISRSADRRTFYIETGLSKDVEGIIQGFVRDIKTKEIKLNDIKTIDSIFRSIGQFQDYFIPQVNGEKAIDIDTISGMNVEIENDFLEYLKKAMISGMALPSSLIQETDQVDFARSLAMINGRFLRSVISLGKQFGFFFTEIFVKLYKNEYGNEIINDTLNKQKDKNENNNLFIDYTKISVKFPSPAALNMTNLLDIIGSARDISDFITTNIVGQNAGDKTRDRVYRIITKELVKNIDWDKFEKLVKENKINEIEDELERKIEKAGNEGEEEY
jgi:hypothetical protein